MDKKQFGEKSQPGKRMSRGPKARSKKALKKAQLLLTEEQVVSMRLDESIPLETEAWLPVKQLLVQLTEFAPEYMLLDLSAIIASYADDQARRGYILGREDLVKELRQRVA